MGKKKKHKKSDKNPTLEKLILATAILNLIEKLIDIVKSLSD